MPAGLQYVVILIALLGLWAIVIRPTRRSQQRVAELQQSIAVGDEVIISAGIFGTIRDLDGPSVQLEIAPGTVVKVAREVVVRRAPQHDAGSGPESTEE